MKSSVPEKKKVKIPAEFINHIVSLGFNKEEAERLYDQKEYWLGINSGGKVLCTHRGCKFSTKVASDELFTHCRIEHQWGEYPCKEENCNYIGYSETTLKHHSSRFHAELCSFNNAYPCSKRNCRATFQSRSLQKVHENIHDNVLIKCVFCPFTCVEPSSLSKHYRVHFNVRNYQCNQCQMSFYTKAESNLHFRQKHSGETTKCPLCDFESTYQNVYNHLARFVHKITGTRWHKETNSFIVPIKKS